MSELPPVVIVVPLEEEFRALHGLLALERLPGDPWEAYRGTACERPVVALISDCGPANAAAAAEYAIATFAPRLILHGGSAGSHDPGLMPGDLVVGAAYTVLMTPAQQEARRARGIEGSLIRFRKDGRRQVREALHSPPALAAHAHWLTRRVANGFGTWPAAGWPANVPRRPANVVVGTVGSADFWTIDPGEIAVMRERFGHCAEDMESAYIAQVCALHALPFLAVRAISNNETACPIGGREVMPAIAAAGERAMHALAAIAREV